MISKKELLKEMNISYGQLYRWKREGLIPDEWFNKQAVSTGQETFFKRDLIIPRINKILELKDKYQLEELRSFFEPDWSKRAFTIREAVVIEEIDPFILRIYMQHHATVNIYELAILYIFSENKDVLTFEEYENDDFTQVADTSHYLYILHFDRYFIMIGSNSVVIDKKLEVYKKYKLEDVVSKIALSLKE